jgi:excisionase family DNA binding protein
MEKQEIFNIKQLSEYLHCSSSLLRKMVYENEIPFFKLHSKYFFKKEIIDKWLITKHNYIEIGGFNNEI